MIPEPYVVETNNTQSLIEVDEAALEAAAVAVLQAESVAAAEISIAVVDGEAMRSLNKKYLDHDYDTDVLSFLLEEAEVEQGRRLEGEIIVSATTAAKEAPGFGWTSGAELQLYVVHGVLHLCGYDDQTDAALEEMRLREKEILGTLGLSPRYSA